ncbi:MAG: alpha-glucan family phosphorylase [Candidatus Hydrogenedentes bacterium]|nr:alpha-glucan family phosphorylase [Candidatus Hydrogenedentota bacterium]
MAQVTKFTVLPRLPERIAHLETIAKNAWWCWDPEAVQLFIRIDRDRWPEVEQNPVQLLGEVSQMRLEELSKDSSFLAHLDRVMERLEDYLGGAHWHEKNPDTPKEFCVAYMSAEFGIHESIKIYSGGLGILAGDHLKAASDLGLPLIGIGLLYRGGYFRQYLNADGWQQETYPQNDFHNMPITRMLDKAGKALFIELPYPERMVKVALWKCQVGRVPLYLLDCDHDENHPDDRAITAQLYGGDRNTRVRQEILLGMGGVQAMHALNISPTTYHMNEGHAAFMTLQRIKDLVKAEGLTIEEAMETVKAASFFTTHTPVPAGNDMFEPALIEHYFKNYCAELGISLDRLMALGRQNPADLREPFCMTVLALKLSAGANGVSKLHGQVARNMWSRTWKDVPENEVPITSITNGIHTQTFISAEMADLYDRYLGPGWIESPDDPAVWGRIETVPDTELWRTHERRRERLVSFSRGRLYQQYEKRGASVAERNICLEVLNPEALTIGFARRFATYKRATLLLLDKPRLKAMIMNSERPIQFIIAGKAHPQDTAGKELIRALFHFARDPDVRNSFIFLENYDINVARFMVQGVDCWLNTPRRPMEASGTSGMKAAANGALNISIPDGWWCEAENLGPNGWSIGAGEMYDNTEEQDRVESEALYDILEQEVIPLFYERGRDGIPRGWIARMKSAIGTIGPVFNTYRMVQEYADRCYVPCAKRRAALRAKSRARVKALCQWKHKVREAWPQVSIAGVHADHTQGLPVGAALNVEASLHLGPLSPEDVTVEIYYGHVDALDQIPLGKTVEMKSMRQTDGGTQRYEGCIHCEHTGQQGFTIRVIPSHADLAQKHEMALIHWA